MKRKNSLILSFLFFTGSLYAQELQTAALYYYNEKNEINKFEQKYVDRSDSSILYVGHFSDGSSCIKIKTIQKEDTIVVIEEYSDILIPVTNVERRAQCDSYGYEVGKNKLRVSCTKTDDNDDSPISFGDTLIARKLQKGHDVVDLLQSARVSMIYEGRIKYDIRQRRVEETVKFYYHQNQLIRIEWWGKKERLYKTTVCRYTDSAMVCVAKHYSDKVLKEIRKVDSIQWNKDTTEIRWKSHAYYLKRTFDYLYKINKPDVKIYFRDTLEQDIQYIRCDNWFDKRLKMELDNDQMYSNDLWRSDKSIIAKITYDDHTAKTYEYKYDKKKRIKERIQYDKGIFTGKVVYLYP